MRFCSLLNGPTPRVISKWRCHKVFRLISYECVRPHVSERRFIESAAFARRRSGVRIPSAPLLKLAAKRRKTRSPRHTIRGLLHQFLHQRANSAKNSPTRGRSRAWQNGLAYYVRDALVYQKRQESDASSSTLQRSTLRGLPMMRPASLLPLSAAAVCRAICHRFASLPLDRRGAVHSCSQYVTRPLFWHTQRTPPSWEITTATDPGNALARR